MSGDLIFLAILVVLALAAPLAWRVWKKSQLVDKISDSTHRVSSKVLGEVQQISDAVAGDYQTDDLDEYTLRHQDLEVLAGKMLPIHNFLFRRAPEAAGFDIRHRLTPIQRDLCNGEWQRLFGCSSLDGLMPVYERDQHFARMLTEDRQRDLSEAYGNLLERYCKLLAHGIPALKQDVAKVNEMLDELTAQIVELAVADWQEKL